MKHFIYILLFLPIVGMSQKVSKSQIAFGIGASSYFGDMDSGNTVSDLLYTSFAVQLRYSYRHNNYFVTNVNGLIGGLKGDDSRSEDRGRLNRNLNFHSPLYEIGIIEEVHPLGKGLFPSRTKLSPYFMIGVAGYHFNPKTKDNNGNVIELQPLGTEGQGAEGYDEKYALTRISIPFGGGLRYKLAEDVFISAELMSRYTGMDYLDDLSKNYVPQSVLLANGGEKAVELSDRRSNPSYEGQRGDVKDEDYYFSYMINLHYTFGRGNRLSGIIDPTIN